MQRRIQTSDEQDGDRQVILQREILISETTDVPTNLAVKPLTKKYFFPTLRFSNYFKVFIFIDAMGTIVSWLSGGNSEYFIENVEHFNFKKSVFDLAVISLLKTPLYFALISVFERKVILCCSQQMNPSLKRSERFLFSILGVVSISNMTFTWVKGGVILDKVERAGGKTDIHVPYFVCLIWNCLTSFIIVIMWAFSRNRFSKLMNFRVIKYYDEYNREVDKQGKLVVRKASLLRLAALAKPEIWLLLAGSAMMLISSAVQIIAPLFFGKVVDAAIESMSSLNHTVVQLLVVYAVGAVAGLVRSWVFTLAGQRLVARLRSRIFAKIVTQEVAFFDINRTGELCNRLASDTQVLQNALTANVSMLLRYSLQIIGSLALMFYLNASLTGVLLAVVPVVSLGAVQYGRFVRKMRQQFQDRLADAGTQAEEAISSIRTVKSFAGEQKASGLYSDAVLQSYQIGKKLAIAQGAMEGLFSFLAYGAISAVLWYGGKLVHDNVKDPDVGISSGLLTSFLLYTLQVAMGFAFLSSLYGDFMQAVGASVRIFGLLDREPDRYQAKNPSILSHLHAELSFQNIRFSYPSRPDQEVLKNVSFTVQAGQMVALVGPSGGGKSTIVSLIERFYDPTHGTILLGGKDIKKLDETWFRQKVALVSQEPTLFACSIRDNIAYGKDSTDQEVITAARMANAHGFISSFEDGYHTLVGERGIRLSGGQKQRVAIARALIMNPVLLLLDEATSALDAESEHLVKQAIDRAMQGRTVIVIAHRLSTVRNADMVTILSFYHHDILLYLLYLPHNSQEYD